MWHFLMVALVILNVLDYQLTVMLIRTAGVEIEGNPLARWLCADHGPTGMLLLKVATVALTVTILHILKVRRRAAAWSLLCGACGLMLTVVAYNGWLICSYDSFMR